MHGETAGGGCGEPVWPNAMATSIYHLNLEHTWAFNYDGLLFRSWRLRYMHALQVPRLIVSAGLPNRLPVGRPGCAHGPGGVH